jgi:nitrile hydratase accessory protein
MTARVDAAVTAMTGAAAPPRRNGELVFDAPWQGRAFGMAVGVVERLGLEWKAFQERLIAAIAAHPDAPYYDCWVAALERLVLDYGAVTAHELNVMREAVRADPL